MSWSEFYIIVSGLITLVLLIVAFPWLRNKNHAKQDSLSNTQIVKQRLAELDREVQEGLISEHDKRQAVDELKLALVDESAFQSHKTGNAKLPLAIGAVLAIACGVIVYAQVNQMGRVTQASQAIESLPELSQQLASGNANNLTQQDIASLALAIRQRLREGPEDDTGWMYFGRLMLSIGQEVQAIEAIDKAVSLAPSNTANRITLAQALMTTGDVNNLERAQSILLGLLNDNPEKEKWDAAVEKEFRAMVRKDVYTEIDYSDLLPGEKPIPLAVLLEKKSDGRNKARAVCLGNRAEPVEDKFAPVANYTTVRLMLAHMLKFSGF